MTAQILPAHPHDQVKKIFAELSEKFPHHVPVCVRHFGNDCPVEGVEVVPDAAAVDMVPAAFLEHGTRQQWAHTMAQLCTEHSRPCDHPAFKTVVLPQTPLGFFVGHPLFWRAGTKHLPYFVPKAA